MKRFVAFFLVLTICVFCVFAYQNTYRLSSDEVQTFLMLRKMSSSMTSDPTYPVSAQQLSNLVKSLDTSNFDEKLMAIYNKLISELDQPQVLFGKGEAGIDAQFDLLGVQMYRVKDPDIYLPYKDRIPMGNFEADFYFGENFFGRAGLDPKKKYNQDEKDLVTVKDAMNYSEGLPFLPMASLGFGNLNLIVGRDRLGAGNGYSGNLTLGENTVFDDFVKLSYVSDLVSYDFTYKHYLTEESGDSYKSKNLYIHRISASLSNAFNLSFYEGVLAAGNFPLVNNEKSKDFDFDYLNPFMLMHNHFKFYSGAVNNFLGFEVTVALPKTWQLSGQYFIDQLLFGGESPEDTGEAASIVLLNASKTSRLGSGILDYYVEGVYGNPYVYLKNTHGYGISSVGSTNHYYNTETYKAAEAYKAVDLISDQIIDRNNGTAQDVQYLGYKYGGDVFVLATGAKYSLENLKLNADAKYIAKGNFGIRDGESRLSEGRADYCSEKFNNVIQHTLIAGFGVNWTFAKGIEISASAAGLANINYHHQASPIAFDYQYSVGVNIHVLDFFDIRKPL